jgi:hypothetical protein
MEPNRWAAEWGYVWAVLKPAVGLLLGISRINYQPKAANHHTLTGCAVLSGSSFCLGYTLGRCLSG